MDFAKAEPHPLLGLEGLGSCRLRPERAEGLRAAAGADADRAAEPRATWLVLARIFVFSILAPGRPCLRYSRYSRTVPRSCTLRAFFGGAAALLHSKTVFRKKGALGVHCPRERSVNA